MRRILLASLLVGSALTAAARDRFNYMINIDGNTVISGTSVRMIESLVDKYPSPFVWVRRNGEEYLIRDTATLAEAKAAFRHSDALHREHTRLSAKMRPLEDREEELDEEIDSITDRDEDDHVRIDEARLETLRREMKSLRQELRQLEREEERLDQRADELSAEAERELERIVDRAIAKGLARRL